MTTIAIDREVLEQAAALLNPDRSPSALFHQRRDCAEAIRAALSAPATAPECKTSGGDARAVALARLLDQAYERGVAVGLSQAVPATAPDELERLRAESEERLQNCAALVAEVERLRAEVTRPESTDMTLMRALVQSQATELERLRKDAERYQWLRSEHKRYDPVCHLTWKQPCDENGSFWVNTAHLDSDIDAAMKGTP